MVKRITLSDYLKLSGRESTQEPIDLGHAWFASDDHCVLGRVVLNPATHMWEPIGLDVPVDEHEYARLWTAERALEQRPGPILHVSSHGASPLASQRHNELLAKTRGRRTVCRDLLSR